MRPEHSGPVTSVMAPSGRPPPSIVSIEDIPVAANGRIALGDGVSAEGIRPESEASTRCRTMAEEGIYSLYVRLTACMTSNLESLKIGAAISQVPEGIWIVKFLFLQEASTDDELWAEM